MVDPNGIAADSREGEDGKTYGITVLNDAGSDIVNSKSFDLHHLDDLTWPRESDRGPIVYLLPLTVQTFTNDPVTRVLKSVLWLYSAMTSDMFGYLYEWQP